MKKQKIRSKKVFKIINKAEKGDDVIDYKGKKIAIKLDVERHEMKVLEGLNNILLNNDIILQVEIFKKGTSIIEFLKSKNFTFLKSIKRDFYFKNFN